VTPGGSRLVLTSYNCLLAVLADIAVARPVCKGSTAWSLLALRLYERGDGVGVLSYARFAGKVKAYPCEHMFDVQGVAWT
jgi:hypothetical protein